MLTAIIVAAGSSRRMGFDKLFALLDGKPVVAHALSAFEQAKSVQEIIVIGNKARLAELRALIKKSGGEKVVGVLAGGEHRQDSVRTGLRKLSAKTEYVAVHDAARPLTRPELIDRVFEVARIHGGASAAAPVTDTLKRADGAGLVVESVEREALFAMQTPQIFRRDLIEKAYRQVYKQKLSVTDEISAVQRLNERVMLVPNEDYNFKITYPADLPLAEFVLRQCRALGSRS